MHRRYLCHALREAQLKTFAVYLGVAAALALGCSGARCVSQFTPAPSSGDLRIEPEGACARNGNFILVRWGSSLVAVRFIAFAPVTTGQVGQGCGQYEAFSAIGGRFDAKVPQRGVLSVFEWRGFHPIAWQPGRNLLRIGSVGLEYFHPGCLALMDDLPGAAGAEFTVTHWRRIEDVNVLDPSLVWYKPDAERAEVKVSR